MQVWLSEELEKCDGIGDLICNIEILDNIKPKNLAEQKLWESYRTCRSSLYLTEKFSENENISLSAGEGLKPDFVLYAPETESIVIVELKNISGPTRQAGTELGAYAGELRTWLPFCATGDIVFVVISVEWPTLLKHFVRHEVFWHSRNIICLQPKEIGGCIKLEILSFAEICEDIFSFKMSERHIGGYQLCLYDHSLYGENPDRTRLDNHLEQMNAALQSMAVQGNSLNSHGFAFLWRDNWEQSLAPYSITMVNAAPFQSIERFFHLEELPSSEMLNRFLKIIGEYDPQGHSDSLSKITKAGRRLLDSFCAPRMEGFTDWGTLRDIMLPRGELVAFIGWGIFGEVFYRELAKEYQSGNINCPHNSPQLGLKVLSEILDPHYEFIDLTHMNLSGDENGDEDEEF